jgi:hypothetical protein
MRTARLVAALFASLLLGACSPADDHTEPDPPGNAAPDLGPETTPPPVPVIAPDTATTAPFDATNRTDVGAVRPDTAP